MISAPLPAPVWSAAATARAALQLMLIGAAELVGIIEVVDGDVGVEDDTEDVVITELEGWVVLVIKVELLRGVDVVEVPMNCKYILHATY